MSSIPNYSPMSLPLTPTEAANRFGDDDIEAYELAHDRACCQTDTIADWLSQECCTDLPYAGGDSSRHIHDAGAMQRGEIEASSLSTPQLLALALGLTPYPKTRLLAMDEIALRAGIPQ